MSISSDPVSLQWLKAYPDLGWGWGWGWGSWLLAIWEMSGKHVVHLEMKRVLNLWCQCDTEMWSLGVARQHTKAGIHRVTFLRLFMVSDHLKKIVLSPEFNVLKTALAPCLFAKWKVKKKKMKSFANRRLAFSSHFKKKKSRKNKRPKIMKSSTVYRGTACCMKRW